jgi:hypothetical protein
MFLVLRGQKRAVVGRRLAAHRRGLQRTNGTYPPAMRDRQDCQSASSYHDYEMPVRKGDDVVWTTYRTLDTFYGALPYWDREDLEMGDSVVAKLAHRRRHSRSRRRGKSSQRRPRVDRSSLLDGMNSPVYRAGGRGAFGRRLAYRGDSLRCSQRAHLCQAGTAAAVVRPDVVPECILRVGEQPSVRVCVDLVRKRPNCQMTNATTH